MSHTLNRILFWLPRALAILLATFLLIFSFDVFGEGHSLWETALTLFMHNLPSIVIYLVIWLTWKREWIASIFFLLLAVTYIIMTRSRFEPIAFFVIGLPLLLISFLYLYGWFYQPARPRTREEPTAEG